ncbi:glycosyltransferase [Candidatus Scalindua japonica]|uniref:Glycosyltransferase n=1 Tax=Candidatus Scalindua japonica TaxID=1284222 RepID=A0A286U146_9BACT|nr:glycosyltransferase [Candidatus Scalindua japonica]GAX61873.1 glycosyltransferase [Candidatus Scalindua japonica]
MANSKKKYKILHAPTSVGGNPYGLAQGERAIGLDSTVVYFKDSWPNYPYDINLHIEQYKLLTQYYRVASFFFKALCTYDIFHFNFGRSFLQFDRLGLYDVDLPIYRKIGKKVVVTFNGCDARQKSYSKYNFNINACAESTCYGGFCNDKSDFIKRKRIEKISKYADKVFSVNPDLLHVLPNAEFIPYTIIDFHNLLLSPTKKNKGNRIKILHAPSDRGAKGTKYILPVLKRIESEHNDVEVILIERIPNNKALEIYKEADLVVDQLLIGWYGGFSVEVMAMGKPVICYIREEDLKFIPKEMKEEMPIIKANPDNLYEVLKETIEDRNSLPMIGEKSRAYVEKWHDPIKIASRMKDVYEDDPLC